MITGRQTIKIVTCLTFPTDETTIQVNLSDGAAQLMNYGVNYGVYYGARPLFTPSCVGQNIPYWPKQAILSAF